MLKISSTFVKISVKNDIDVKMMLKSASKNRLTTKYANSKKINKFDPVIQADMCTYLLVSFTNNWSTL